MSTSWLFFQYRKICVHTQHLSSCNDLNKFSSGGLECTSCEVSVCKIRMMMRMKMVTCLEKDDLVVCDEFCMVAREAGDHLGKLDDLLDDDCQLVGTLQPELLVRLKRIRRKN